MNEPLLIRLEATLQAFETFDSTTPVHTITDAYHRLLELVQLIMLEDDNPDGHDRAWSLLNDDAFKDLAQIQEGNTSAFEDLKFKISQVGHLLLNS